MSKRAIIVTPEQARAIFDALQVAASQLELRIEARAALGDLRLEQLMRGRVNAMHKTFATLGAELQDIAALSFDAMDRAS